MASSIFGHQRTDPNPVLRIMQQVRNGGGARAFGEALAASNPAFADFVRATSGKSVEQVAAGMGVDMAALKSVIR